MTWTAWQPWAIGAIAVLVMLRYVVRALFADRARGRPRCLRCAHPFVEGQGLTCTECGWTAKRPEDLLRTRRHWGKAAAALGIMLVLAVTVRLLAVGGDPLMLVPSRILVALLPVDPPGITGRGPIANELRRRLIGDGLSESTESALAERVVQGDGDARPGDDAWRSRYGMLADDLRERHGSPSDPLSATMLRLPPRIELSVPDGWPSDAPVPAELLLRDWWPVGTEAIVTIAPASDKVRSDGDAGAESWHEIGYRNHASIQRRHHLMLPPSATWPEDDAVEVTFRLRRVDPELAVIEDATTGESWDDGEEAVVVRTTVALARPTAKPAPTLEPWAGDETIDAMVASVFDRGLRRWAGTRRPFAIRFNPNRLADSELEGVHFGLIVDIVERRPDGEEIVRRRTRMWMPGGGLVSRRGRASGWTISEEDTAGLAGAFDPANDSTWLLRIRGDEALAGLAAVIAAEADTAPDADAPRAGESEDDRGSVGRWWSGSVERPLPIESAEGRPFIRMWFHPDGVRLPSADD